EVRTVDQLVAEARALKAEWGFTTHKLKGGVFPPRYELECYRALAEALPGDSLRFDPNGVWSTEQAVWFARQIEDLNNDYLEDPVFGLHGMRRARERIGMPLATNTVVVGFEQLAANVLQTAVDVILLDTTFWGGIRPCVKAAGICEAFQFGVARYHEEFRRLGTYPYDQDPLRPGWAPLIPNARWADPADARVPHVPA